MLAPSPGSWDSFLASNASVIKDGSGYKMYYMGNDGMVWRMGLATSDDGITWTKYAANPLFAPRPGAWDSQEVGHPSVLLLDGLYHMWYTDAHAIGHATSTDGIAWTWEQPCAGGRRPQRRLPGRRSHCSGF